MKRGTKFLKIASRFILRSCDIYQNPLTQETILKFRQCRTKKKKIKSLNVKYIISSYAIKMFKLAAIWVYRLIHVARSLETF
jgi:hypothetical protein